MVHVLKIDSDAALEACHRLRRVVFVEEQRVPVAEEWDDLDGVCTHFLALPDAGARLEEAVGTARLYVTESGTAKAQRVAVLRTTRGQGVGRALMDALEAEVRARGLDEVVLGAQLTAIPFYERLGYAAYGPEFDDAGIPHRMMRKRV